MRSQCDRSAAVNPSDFAGKVCRLWFLDEAVLIWGIFAQGRHAQRQAWRTLRSLPRWISVTGWKQRSLGLQRSGGVSAVGPQFRDVIGQGRDENPFPGFLSLLALEPCAV